MDLVKRVPIRPTGADVRCALVEFGLTTTFMATVFSLVRWGIDTTAPTATATELRVRVAVVSMVVGLVIVGFADSPPGRLSGAHMNPAITLGLFAFGAVPARRVLPYLVAQGAGSVAAALVTRLAWGPAVGGWAVRWTVVRPARGWGGPVVALVEAATLAVIVAVMCAVKAERDSWPLAWIVGGLFGLQGALFGTLTGGSANPARQLGPAVFSGEVHLLAVYLVAPAGGAVLAGWAAYRLRAGRRPPGKAGAGLCVEPAPAARRPDRPAMPAGQSPAPPGAEPAALTAGAEVPGTGTRDGSRVTARIRAQWPFGPAPGPSYAAPRSRPRRHDARIRADRAGSPGAHPPAPVRSRPDHAAATGRLRGGEDVSRR